jgi:hypothetical protein
MTQSTVRFLYNAGKRRTTKENTPTDSEAPQVLIKPSHSDNLPIFIKPELPESFPDW